MSHTETNKGDATHPAVSRPVRWASFATLLVGAAAMLFVFWAGSACCLQRCALFPNYFLRASKNPRLRPGTKRIWIKTDQGKIEAWIIPPRASSPAGPPTIETEEELRPAVIYAHGNGELIDRQGSVVRGYNQLGVTVMLCEYRGYGRSAGTPSQRKIVSDHVKCYERLARTPGVDPKRIFFHGYSLGTGVVCALSLEKKAAAMILQSPFTSVAALMARYLIPRLFVLDPFDNVEALHAYDGPVLIMHGTKDRLIPVEHGRKLHEIARNSVLLENPYGHSNIPRDRQYWSAVRAFLRESGVI